MVDAQMKFFMLGLDIFTITNRDTDRNTLLFDRFYLNQSKNQVETTQTKLCMFTNVIRECVTCVYQVKWITKCD